MPKLKTNRGAAKRFKMTGSGQVQRFKANKSHLLTKKNSKRKRYLRKPTTIDSTNLQGIRRLLPYG